MNFQVGDKVKVNDPVSDYHKSSAVVTKAGARSYDIKLENGLSMRAVEEQIIGVSKK